jgi:hypothetical protein
MVDSKLPPSLNYGLEMGLAADLTKIEDFEARVKNTAQLNDALVLVGAYSGLVSLCNAFRQAGAAFSIAPPTLAAVQHYATTDTEKFLALGKQLRQTVAAAQAAGLQWVIDVVARVESQAPKPAAEPKPAPPLEMRIVGMPALAVSSMPARRTETTVHRDADDEITGSTAVERDAA